AALADPGLAADEQQDGPTACSRVECPLDSPELLVAANDDRARTRRHAADGTAAGLRLSAERGSGALRDQRRTTLEGGSGGIGVAAIAPAAPGRGRRFGGGDRLEGFFGLRPAGSPLRIARCLQGAGAPGGCGG